MGIDTLIFAVSLIVFVTITNLMTWFIFRLRFKKWRLMPKHRLHQSLTIQFMFVISAAIAIFGSFIFAIGNIELSLTTLSMAGFVYTLLVLALGLFFSRTIVIPLQALILLAQNTAAGDTKSDTIVNIALPEKRKDEIGLLAKTVDSLTQRMGHLADTASNDNDEIGRLDQALASLSQRNRQLAEAANHIAAGNLTVAIEPESARDDLGQAFANMLGHVRRVVAQVQAGTSALHSAEGQLSQVTVATDKATQQIVDSMSNIALSVAIQTNAVSQTNTNMDNLGQSIEHIATGASSQAEEVQRLTTVFEAMAATMTQVNTQVQSASGMGQRVNQAAEAGANSVQAVLQSMARIGTSVEKVTSQAQAMATRSKEIGAVIATIEDIASQTELLALNAAIEAAKAGEQGKSFGVIADAVRALSNRAKAEAHAIADLIHAVQSDIQKTVSAMDQSAEDVQQGNNLADSSRQTLNDILQAVAASNGQLAEIMTAVQEMSTAKDQVIDAVETVSAIVEENAAMTQEMAATSVEVRNNIKIVSQVSQDTSTVVGDINNTVGLMNEQVDQVIVATGGLKNMTLALESSIGEFNLSTSGKKAHTGPRPLKIAYLPIADHIVLPLAYLRQIETQQGRPIQIMRCTSWPALIEALRHEADGALMLAPLAAQLSLDLPLQVVMLVHRDGSGLVVDNNIKDLPDLKGKVVAIPHTYSMHNILLHKALARAGLNYDDVEVITAPPPLMPYLLKRGNLAGFISAEPAPEVALANGAGKLAFLSNEIEDNHICCVLAMRPNSLVSHKEATLELVEGFRQAGHWIEANPQATAQAVSPFLGIAPNLMQQILITSPKRITFNDLEPRAIEFEAMLQAMMEMKLLSTRIDPNTLVDYSYYQTATTLLQSQRVPKQEKAVII